MQHSKARTIALLMLTGLVSSASASLPAPLPQSFRQLLADNDAIVVLQLMPDAQNPKQYARDAVLLEVIRNRHPLPAVAKTIRMELPSRDEPVKQQTFIVFGTHSQGQWDWYRGIESDPQSLQCIKGLLNLNLKDSQQLLRYAFDFLKCPNAAVADHAFEEWARASSSDVSAAAKQLPSDKVRALVVDRQLGRPVRHRASLMLGHCGEEKDAALIRQLIETEPPPNKHTSSYVDDSLKGYAVLKPKEGWAYLGVILKNPEQPFYKRYACLQAARYFHTDHPKVIAKQAIEQLLADTLDQDDFADFAIDDFRKWKCWDYTKRVLARFDSTNPKSHRVVHNAVLRYALQCPDPACAEFAAKQRRGDRQWVADVEENLKLEAEP